MNQDTTRRTAQRVAAAALASAFTAIASAATPGSAAPDIAATDVTGKVVKLSDFRGKYVVLEWTNPECPFVQKHYDSKNMQGLQKEWGAKEVVWLSVPTTTDPGRTYPFSGRIWWQIPPRSPRIS